VQSAECQEDVGAVLYRGWMMWAVSGAAGKWLGRGYHQPLGGGGVKMGEGRTKEEKSVIYRCQVLANNNVLSKPWVNK